MAEKVIEFVADEERMGAVPYTGVYVRARTLDGGYDSIDCAYLNRGSFIAWLLSKPPVFTLNVLLSVLDYDMMTQEEFDAHV